MCQRIKVLLFFIFIGSVQVLRAQYVGVIPQPESITLAKDSCLVLNNYNIDKQHLHVSSYQYFRNELLNRFQIIGYSNSAEKSTLEFNFLKSKNVNTGYYELIISKSGIQINALDQKGFFYGMNTFIQLLDYAKLTKTHKLPYLTIKDQPQYAWRGFMLDEARHFFGKEKVKQLLDWMAYYKLNTFHWHLTDEPAWRIEIKQYPFLTLIGAVGSFLNPLEEAKYYTQEDINEIVSYAQERQIEVIPEIDMPGHATAANRAYPQFSGGGTKEHPDFTFHPAKEGTYRYLTNILKEVNVLFPSNMIHLGGDEVAFGSEAWNRDSDIQSLKDKYGYTTNKEVETHFMRRMADTVYSLGAKLIVWDEMVDANLPKEKTIQFWWRHDKPIQLEKSLKNGYQTVICPRIPFYFDFVQFENHRYGRKWGKAFNSLDIIYNYDLKALHQYEQYKGQILGIQGNLWTERVHNEQRLDFMVFPRIAALAEIGWSKDNRKDFNHFKKILINHLELYASDGIYYYDPFYNSNSEPKVQQTTKKYIDNPE